MHGVFHVSQLQKFIPDPLQPVLLDTVEVEKDIYFKPQPIQNINRVSKILRNKEIPLVKDLWEGSHPVEATWELESKMRESNPYLFQLNP